MYCPKCATLKSDDQKFCRSCGQNLEIIAEVVNDRSKADRFEAVSAAEKRRKRRKKRLANTGVLLIMASLLLGCVIPILIGIGVPNLNSVIMIIAGIAGLALFGGAGLLIYSDMSAEPPEMSESEMSERSPDVPEQKNAERLSSGESFEPARSVVENTTRELETEKVKVRR